MKLTTYSNYTMRVLMVAAARAPQLVTIKEVASAFSIPKTHLVKCVHNLGTWGYLETVRGHHGGFRLAKPASKIRVGEIMRRTEDGFAVVECMDPDMNTCRIAGKCGLSKGLRKATDAFLAVLDEMTLEDISANGMTLLKTLGL